MNIDDEEEVSNLRTGTVTKKTDETAESTKQESQHPRRDGDYGTLLGFHRTTESAQKVVGESIYLLFLTKKPFAIFAALAFYTVQIAILAVYGFADWQKGITRVAICRKGIGLQGDVNEASFAPVCEETPGLKVGHMILIIMVLFFHTGGEMVKGLQLVALAAEKGKDSLSRILMLILGLGIFVLAVLTCGVTVRFVSSKSDNFVLAVGDAFILLFVLDCDENAFNIIKHWNQDYANSLKGET